MCTAYYHAMKAFHSAVFDSAAFDSAAFYRKAFDRAVFDNAVFDSANHGTNEGPFSWSVLRVLRYNFKHKLDQIRT